LDLAKRDQLHQPQVLAAQVHRMLQDQRSFALSANFAREWLHLQNMQSVQPDAFLFPNYTKNLGDSMVMETELFFNSVVHDDASVLTLLDGHYTYVNQRLAQLYGIPDVLGTRFRRVELTDPNRFGLLGQASLMTLTSASNRTTPTIRGKYIMEVLLGSPPPPPPPIVPALEEATNRDATRIPTVRERLEEHRKNPTCAACHSFMDPIGFALENYNPIGGWRTFDSGAPIDAAGKLFDGTAVNSPADLRSALVAHSDSFIGTFTENLFAYGVGRVLRPVDMPVIRSIERDAAAHNEDFSAFVLGIVNSEPFGMRSAEPLSKHLLATIDNKNSTPSKAATQQH
jgi:PAS domain-containing protein